MKKISCLSVISLAVLLGSNSFAAHVDYKAEGCKSEPIPVAIPVISPVGLKDGFYAGVGLGYDSYRVRQGLTVADTGGPTSFNPQLSATGWNGSLFGGYGQYYNRFYIAGEMFVNTSNASAGYAISSAADLFRTSVDVRSSYGIAILPGFKVNNSTLLYGKLGFTRTQFKTQERDVTPVNANRGPTNAWGNGLNYGLGLETAVYPCVSMRGEYTYTTYGAFTSHVGTKFSPSNNQFVLSAIYHFA